MNEDRSVHDLAISARDARLSSDSMNAAMPILTPSVLNTTTDLIAAGPVQWRAISGWRPYCAPRSTRKSAAFEADASGGAELVLLREARGCLDASECAGECAIGTTVSTCCASRGARLLGGRAPRSRR